MRKPALLLAATVVTALVVGGMLVLREPEPEDGGDTAPPTAREPAPAATLADVDTTGLVVTRDAFCDALPEAAVADALGGEPTAADAYANGERAVLADGVEDVAHEFGCVWSTGTAEVRAWVFAPPVSADDARALRKAALRTDGCRPSEDAAGFGDPTVALVCRTPDGPVVSYRGLFGDAWLACSVGGAGSREQVADRADRWCAAAALAASSDVPS